MTEFQREFLSLVKASFTEETPCVSDEFAYKTAYSLAESQQMVPILYYGALKDPRFATEPTSQYFFERTCVHIGHNEDQLETVRVITDAFDAAGIDYMPLKGTLLKGLYPSPEMRVMGDSDILIRVEDEPRIREIMLSLGCRFDNESDHEFNWSTATGLHIELHKRLIPSYNEDYYAYYGDGWRLAHPAKEGSTRYEMNPEDLFIYLFTHFAKHYRDQGAGMKYVIDFYVFKNCYPSLDLHYVSRELEKLQLYEFYSNIMRLIAVWFEGEAPDEITDYLTEKIFGDGVFGRAELNIVSEGLKLSKSSGSSGSAKSARSKKIFQLVFPSYKNMCLQYPILKKWAILLPILWIIRAFDVVFNRRYLFRHHKERMENMSAESISNYQRELNYVGLDYNFGESDPPNRAE